MRIRSFSAVALTAGLLAACGGGTEPGGTGTGTTTGTATETQAGGETPEKLVLGLVPSREANKLVTSAQPLADAIEEAVGIPVEATVPQDYTALTEAMASGEAHIGAFGPLGIVQAMDRAGVEFIAQSIRFGSDTYHTQWMTHVDNADTYCSDEVVQDDEGYWYCNGTLDAETGPVAEEAIANVPDDATIAYVDQTSTSGYLIPALQLVNAGKDLESLNGTFAGGHDAAVIAVSDKSAEVGLSFDDARGVAFETNPEVKDNVLVFAYSQEIPNDGFTVAGDLPEDLKQKITEALLDFASTEEGKQVLTDIYEIDGLQPADPAALDVVREANEKLGDLILEG